LLDAGAIAPHAVEDAELAVQARAAEVAAARAHAVATRAEVAQATAALLYAGADEHGVVLVRAPAAGRVLRLPDRSERVIAPGAVIAEIGDTHGMEVVADVNSVDAARIAAGAPVTLTGSGGAETIAGCVRLVVPSATMRVSALGVEEQRVDVLIDVPEAPSWLGDGYRVEASIVVWASPEALTVPASALVRLGDAWGVYAVDRGRARPRRVRVGEMGGAMAQVLGGVREGDTVVVFPSDKLRAGMRVAAR